MSNLIVAFRKFENDLKISLTTVESAGKCYMANRYGKRNQSETLGP
jgi:tryptophan synthase beta subunit